MKFINEKILEVQNDVKCRRQLSEVMSNTWKKNSIILIVILETVTLSLCLRFLNIFSSRIKKAKK